MKKLVEIALEELRLAFPQQSVEIDDDGQGGAFVRVNEVEFGQQFAPPKGWVAFHITATYPHSDIYGHYFPPELKRTDGKELGSGYHPARDMPLGKFQGKAIFVSRKANRWNPAQDTAALNLRMILDWMVSR